MSYSICSRTVGKWSGSAAGGGAVKRQRSDSASQLFLRCTKANNGCIGISSVWPSKACYVCGAGLCRPSGLTALSRTYQRGRCCGVAGRPAPLDTWILPTHLLLQFAYSSYLARILTAMLSRSCFHDATCSSVGSTSNREISANEIWSHICLLKYAY